MLTIHTVKPSTVFGFVSVNDFQPARLDPSEMSVPADPHVVDPESRVCVPGRLPSVAGSLNALNAREDGLTRVRREAARLWPEPDSEKPVKPGTFSTAVGSASGS